MVDPLLQCVLFMCRSCRVWWIRCYSVCYLCVDLVVYGGSAATVCVIYVRSCRVWWIRCYSVCYLCVDLVVYGGSAATVCVIYVRSCRVWWIRCSRCARCRPAVWARWTWPPTWSTPFTWCSRPWRCTSSPTPGSRCCTLRSVFVWLTGFSSLFLVFFFFFPQGARCSSVVRAFTHGAMSRRIHPSWGGPIELFLVPASAPRLV